MGDLVSPVCSDFTDGGINEGVFIEHGLFFH